MSHAGPCLVTAMLSLVLNAALGGSASAHPSRPVVLPEADESALALSAAPEALRAGAGIWILTASGYREVRPTTNGYTCIVNREELEAIKPTCYDPEGTATILPAVVFFGNRLMEGAAAVRQELDAAFKAGRFRSPSRAGIAFMLSTQVVSVTDAAKGV